MARDNFSKDLKIVLCQQVGGKCSDPDCRITTIGPHETVDKRTSIGVAAHISAASRGGPRYDETMSEAQRKSAENGIWLCQNHAWEIDANPEKYAVSLLEEWKANAILIANKEIGQRQLSQSEASAKAIDTLLTHSVPSFEKNKITSLIETVHHGVAAKYEQLDPRFNVKTSYDGSNLLCQIDANEEVPLTLKVSEEAAHDFTKQFEQLLSHGSEVEISTDNIEIKGSPLFEQLIQQSGIFTIMPTGKAATLKLAVFTKQSDIPFTFDDIVGKITRGSQSTSFDGVACDGLLSVGISVDHSSPHFNLQFKLNWQRWFECALTKLPYFNKVLHFFKSLDRNGSLGISIEIDGEPLFNTTSPMNDELSEATDSVTVLLDYLAAARTICKHTQSNIRFDIESVEYQIDDYDFVLKQAALLESSATYTSDELTSPITATFTVEESGENLRLVSDPKAGSVRIQQSDIKVKLLGTWVQLPVKRTTCGPVIPVISPEDTSHLKSGDEFKVLWEPTENFICIIDYITANN